jgi:hypothetical protein
MTQPARKSPIPIRADARPPQALSLLSRLLEHYEKRGIVTKAITCGVLVGIVGLSLDYLTSALVVTWIKQRLIENTIEGALFAMLVWIVLSVRDRSIRRRFREVGYLNHHIRNSLTVIEMAEGYVAEADQRLDMVKKATARIKSCIEKISRAEDVEISERSPHEP